MSHPDDGPNGKPSESPPCEFDTSRLSLKIDETIPAEHAAVSTVVDKIMAALEEMGCAKGQEFEIRLALSEALTNAVEHGCKNDPTKEVEVCVECDPERGMLIVVRDPGEGFNPESLPSPLEGERLYHHRGRGVYLINRLMDEVRFNRRGTEIRMRKRDAVPKP